MEGSPLVLGDALGAAFPSSIPFVRTPVRKLLYSSNRIDDI
jgi:hypothetical protein